jgi:hypothetical protein
MRDQNTRQTIPIRHFLALQLQRSIVQAVAPTPVVPWRHVPQRWVSIRQASLIVK